MTRFRAPAAVVDVDLVKPWPPTGVDLAPYDEAYVLVRLHGTPVCAVRTRLANHVLDRATLAAAVVDRCGGDLAMALARDCVRRGVVPGEPDASGLFHPVHPHDRQGTAPVVTVAICTRDRPDGLAQCLDSVMRLDYPDLDVVVVDNAPASRETEDLVRDRYPHARYVREPRPGLDWARNRAIEEARGEILAFTDDDVVVDAGWVDALVRMFEADPAVMAVTGLVLPHELETEAQHLFEAYGGFGRGFRRRWLRARSGRPAALEFGGAGAFGTGANMAYRRRVFDLVGGFDPALDVGTATNGGGDLEMFFRVLKEGHTLVYEPAAVVRHRHRRDYARLRSQIANNGTGFYSYLVRTYRAYPDERRSIARLGVWWFQWWSLRRLVRALAGREAVPIDLVLVELAGSIRGLFRYARARRDAAAIAAAHPGGPPGPRPPRAPRSRLEREAVRRIDVAEPLEALTGLEGYRRVHVFVFWRELPLGRVVIDHDCADVSALQLEDAIVSRLAYEILDARRRIGEDAFWQDFVARIRASLTGRPMPAAAIEEAPGAVLPGVPVSVVVATRDRPVELRACLASLVSQRASRRVEIVVVDNNPSSDAAAEVVRDFPGVTLLAETRPGLSYARNRGILASTGEIVACTDDDVVCPPGWIEALVAPFERGDVMVVTGNVLPAELDTTAQQMFEMYGGLGRGFRPWLAGPEWFRRRRRSVPTWELGCTANAAFRASIFSDPRIGLMDEALGAGTPAGCSEDTYVFYRVLKAGGRVAYEPRAYVWHRHRRTTEAFRRQLYAYSKGHVAYHLLTLVEQRDPRALVRLAGELPAILARRAVQRLLRRTDYPLTFIAIEALGYAAGPWALWRSRRRVRRLGSSGACAAPGAVKASGVA